MKRWLSWKELKSSLSLPTHRHMLICPFKDEATERVVSQDGLADARIILVACLPPTSQRLRKWQGKPARRGGKPRLRLPESS